MELSPDLVMPRVRCAPFHGSLAADPIGSAGSYGAFLFVEVPLPWEKDISLNEPFASLMDKSASVAAPDGTRWRPMGIVAPDRDEGAPVRVTAYESSTGPDGTGPYVRTEWSVPTERLVEVCGALLGGADRASFDDVAAPVDDDVVDLFVCTHGRRDSCCGSLGPGVHQELEGRLASDPRLRLGRCSHTGGHRFAPTALSFPDGYAWAHLTADVAERVARREGPPRDLAAHCRGTSLFDGGPVQAADRAGLVRVGWSWASGARRAEVVAFERDTLATTVRITGTPIDGPPRTFDVRVELERHIPAPTCGVVDGPEFKVEPVWRVAAADELAAEPQ